MGLVQGAGPCASRAQEKVAPGWSALKETVADVAEVVAGGRLVIVVTGPRVLTDHE